MLPELRSQRSTQCRKTNWSKLSLSRGLLSTSRFCPSTFSSKVVRSFRRSRIRSLTILRLRRPFVRLVPFSRLRSVWILLIKGIQSEKKLNVTSWPWVRLDVQAIIQAFLMMWDGESYRVLPLHHRLLLSRRPRLVDRLLLYHCVATGTLSLYFMRTKVKIRKDFWCYHVSSTSSIWISSAESYLASITFGDPWFKGLVCIQVRKSRS